MKTLLSALVLAIAASSHALDLNITLSSSVDLSNAVFAYKSTATGSSDEGGAPLGDIAAGIYTGTASVNGDLSQYESYRYSLMATYVNGTDGHTGVVIALNPATTITATGSSFETVFGTSESSIVSALQGLYSNNPFVQLASYSTLTSFAESNIDKLPMGVTGGSLVAFSNGAVVGTMNAAPVPEPATLTALGLGAAAMLRRRRRS